MFSLHNDWKPILTLDISTAKKNNKIVSMCGHVSWALIKKNLITNFATIHC